MSEVITRSEPDGSVPPETPEVRWAPAEPAPKRRHLGLKIGIPVAVVTVGAVAASLVLIAPGTAVAGVPVGWQTPGMAADTVSSHVAGMTVSLGEGGPTVSAADLGASVDAGSLADAAFAQSPMWNLGSWFSEVGGAEISLDAERATATLRAAAPELYTDPTPAAVSFEDSSYTVSPAVDGSGIALEDVRAALEDGLSDGSATVVIDPTAEPVASATTTEMAEATADTLNEMIDNAGFYAADERVVAVSATKLASWLTVDTDASGAFTITADPAAIQATVDGLPEKVDQDPESAEVLTSESGAQLVTLVEGQDGRVLGDTDGIARDFAEQLTGGNAAYDLPVEVTPRETVTTTRLAEVDLSEQRIYLRENDKVIDTWLISSGREGAVTFTGRYSIGWRTPLQDMSGTSRDTGSKYTQPDVPWVMYFNGNQAFHGAYWHDNFGNRMSAGCVNMPPHLAKKLYDWLPNGADVWIHA
ncbi:L,D-transpeptidase family protein [Microbacterium sp. 179-B 1A2 NHS]|uniref:L,D-transpeptidase family protein n=1 Tax=Microbacterium sp. 179-B 1A2 NHS TaxID=3142383 RepID=UPI00399FB5FD